MGTLIIDLDNTIIGNITYQLLAHNLGVRSHKNVNVGKYYREDNGLIRPGFCEFIRSVRERLPNTHIHIYTASLKSWALKEVRWIEQNCNIKFDRPIFTRNDCININNVFYKSMKKIRKRLKNHNNNVLIIDNSDVFIDQKECFVKCPTYNTIHFIDLWKLFPIENKQNGSNNELLQWLSKLVKQGYVNPYPDYTIENTETLNHAIQHHAWFAKKLNTVSKNNKKFANDTWWKHLNNILVTYNLDNIKDIKKYIKL